MKKSFYALVLLFLISCNRNPFESDNLKYSKSDLPPLTDSTKALYYKDAAYLEFENLCKNKETKYSQVRMDENNIQHYYDDLLTIYNNSYKISDSFFENFFHIHTFGTIMLYGISVGVDTSKSWVGQWVNGNNETGLDAIDSIIGNYDLEITHSHYYLFGDWYSFKIKSKEPINYYALIQKFKDTGEFRYVDPWGLAGDGSTISFESGRAYKFALRWGDCPAGCINSHYWQIEVENNRTALLKEGGAPITQLYP